MRPAVSRQWPRFSRFARRGSDALDAGLALHGDPLVTSVSPAELGDREITSFFWPMPFPPPSRERRLFPRHRTPSASKEPSSGPSDSPHVSAWLVVSTPLHPGLPFFADLPLWARSPSAPPAATGEACLDQTSLTDFYNHTKDRAHWTNVRTSPETPFLTLLVPALRGAPGIVSGGVSPAPESAGPAGRSRPSQHARGGSRGQLELLRTSPCRQPNSKGAGTSPGKRLTKTPPSARRTNGTGLREAGDAFNLQEARAECRSLLAAARRPRKHGFQSNRALFTSTDSPP